VSPHRGKPEAADTVKSSILSITFPVISTSRKTRMPVDIAVKNPRARGPIFLRKAMGSPIKIVNPAMAPRLMAVQFIRRFVF